jgi:hypothetical protein
MKSLKLILGILMFGWLAYATLFRAVPRFYSEWVHAAEFVPAKNATLVEAKCTNWDLGMFNDCVVKAMTPSGEKFEIEDLRFGRAPSGSVQLLERATLPPTYTTSVSLATLNERLYFLICATILSVLFAVGLILYVVRAVRTGKWSPRQATLP